MKTWKFMIEKYGAGVTKHLYLSILLFLLILSISPHVLGQAINPCVLSELHLRSQGDTSTISGSGDVEDDPAMLSGNGVLEHGSIARMLELRSPALDVNTLAAVGRHDNNVLLLIIDDFTAPLRQRAHGDYVLEVATVAYHSLYNGHRIAIHTVDYAPEPTLASVITNTKARFTELDPTNNTYDVVVLNMSWVILDCVVSIPIGEPPIQVSVQAFYAFLQEGSLEYDLNEDGMVSFIEYIIGTTDLEPSQEAEIVEALGDFIAATSLDTEVITTFRSMLNGQLGISGTFGGTIVPIAAAGNFSTSGTRREAYAPAALDNVIAVSGSRANDSATMWDSSHNGQLMAPAAWHPTITDEYLSGTSFATPLVSVFISFMAQNHDCDFSPMLGTGKGSHSNVEFISEILNHC